jgi:hypothetical protein
VTLVITTCTNRKRKPIGGNLHMSSLPLASLTELASGWAQRIAAEDGVFPAGDIYGGRSFKEAALAANRLNARLMVVSAGLGLIDASERIPPYACTVLAGAPDSISARVRGDYSMGCWWEAIGAVSPYAYSLPYVAQETSGIIYAAMSDAYIEMISRDLCALPVSSLSKFRIFTRAPLVRIAASLRPYVMPYDDRLDGPDSPVRGTRGDFAGRALRHFAEFIVLDGEHLPASKHAAAVTEALADWRMAARFDRLRLGDPAVLDLIREHWDAQGGSTARLLRLLRDNLQVACEQGRFANLARQVRGERK